ncbi:MAG TPA: quinolinate synthase NadA, partial [Virgibacillus sp.]|nr:quinolinate synthase NadA [Virgibacillus sp.]
VSNIEHIRKSQPDTNIIVHPECSREVVALSDYAGSTKYIIETISSAAKGTKWAVGTEMNLVNRLTKQHPDKEVFSLNPLMCPCLTMNRIDLPHLLWALESISGGEITNQITVEEAVAEKAMQALTKMLVQNG